MSAVVPHSLSTNKQFCEQIRLLQSGVCSLLGVNLYAGNFIALYQCKMTMKGRTMTGLAISILMETPCRETPDMNWP